MKKLFFFLSLALAVIATGCKDNQKSQPVEVPKVPVEEKNSGDDHIIYQYYLKTKDLCGAAPTTIEDEMKKMQLEQATSTVYFLNKEDHSVEINFIDVDDDSKVDKLSVTVSPSEAEKHKEIITYKYVKEFAKFVGKEDKMFATGVPCRFYAFYSQAGAMFGNKNDLEGFLSDKWVTSENMNGGMIYWLDSSVSEYIPNNKEKPQKFTGMFVRPIQVMKGDNPTNEYKVNFTFVIDQVL